MRRVDEAVKQVLSEAIPDLKDPRIGFVTVTGVRTTTDLAQATVYVSVLGGERQLARTLEGLARAHGVLQSRIARELRLRRTPQLAFAYDPSVERGVRMTRLIDDLAPPETAETAGGAEPGGSDPAESAEAVDDDDAGDDDDDIS